jgi:putative ligand-binding protein with streptavidin-like fold
MRIATAAFLLAALAGCGTYTGSSDDAATPSETASSSTPSATPSPSATNALPEEAADLIGDWEDPKEKWTVHLRDDGTYVEDYQGVKDFRVGEYTVDGDTVTLEGDDGNTDEGTIEGETLVFKLGTLERVE